MTKKEFKCISCILNDLNLTQQEAARLLSVTPRTIRHWFSKNFDEVPGPIQQALIAWRRLHQLGMPWRPDGVEVVETDPIKIAEQIALYRNHAIDLDALLQRVKARRGPAAQWHVDLNKGVAILGKMHVGFYKLPNNGFSPASYWCADRQPDLERDQALLDDAYACIASTIADQRKVQPPNYQNN